MRCDSVRKSASLGENSVRASESVFMFCTLTRRNPSPDQIIVFKRACFIKHKVRNPTGEKCVFWVLRKVHIWKSAYFEANFCTFSCRSSIRKVHIKYALFAKVHLFACQTKLWEVNFSYSKILCAWHSKVLQSLNVVFNFGKDIHKIIPVKPVRPL